MTHVYRIISTFDGSTETCSLSELSQNLKINCILAELNTDGTLINSWPMVHETLVTFSVEFADYALLNYTKKKLPEAEACIALTRKWLKNHDSVPVEELTAAAAAASYAAAAANAAAAAADATYVAYAAAHAAADAAYAASYAAAYAANAAYADAYAASAYAAHAANSGKSREGEYVRQGQFIVEYLRAVDTRSCDAVAA